MKPIEYWTPQVIENPKLYDDLKSYFFKDCDSSIIETLVRNNKNELTIICDRYEFVIKMDKLKKIFEKKRTYKNGRISTDNIEGKEVLKVTKEEEIILEGIEFNGITYDIDALRQYLLLTMLDTIMGKIEFEDFVTWLRKQDAKNSHSINDLVTLQNRYNEENGLRRNFIKAFNDHISTQLKERIVNTFLIAKLNIGSIDEENLKEWNNLKDNEKYNRIVKYLYDKIRCMYTHTSTRSFLPNTDIRYRQPTKKKILIAKKDPKTENLIEILKEVIRELVVQKYIKKAI